MDGWKVIKIQNDYNLKKITTTMVTKWCKMTTTKPKTTNPRHKMTTTKEKTYQIS